MATTSTNTIRVEKHNNRMIYRYNSWY